MTTTAPDRLMTAEELEGLPDDGNSYELSRGRLICMSPSSTRPGIVAWKLNILMGSYVLANNLGLGGTADSGLKLASNPDTVRAPDVWFIRADRLPTPQPSRGFWEIAPDLAVEVLSPSDRWPDVLDKVAEYLRAGTIFVWVIDPEHRFALIFRAGDPPELIREDGILDGGDLLPGFTLRLADVLN